MEATLPSEDRDDAPEMDHIIVLRDMTWSDYQRLLEARGDRPVPRLAYLEGAIELMSPSQPHERLKSWIGRLVEVYCDEAGIEFSTYGSWTLESKELERGLEPDECWIFGRNEREAGHPDLAVEVIWTSGGLNKLEIYRKLRVREVWIWRRGQLTAHALRADSYEAVESSEVLPGIDLDQLTAFLDRPTTSQAMREYRQALRAG